MSFGLGKSFGRIVKVKEELPEFIIINDERSDYFIIITKDGKMQDWFETEEIIFQYSDCGMMMVNKQALKYIRPKVFIS
jgi:hypothetical protein